MKTPTKTTQCRAFRPAILAAVLAAGALPAPGAHAGDGADTDYGEMDLEDLMALEIPTVTSASKHAQKITEAPAAVSVITRDEIRRYGWRNLGDLMRSVRGFYVSYDRGYGYVGARGFNRTRDYGGRLLLLVDGHRMNDPAYGTFANRQDALLDLDLIERVEVVRGPGGSLYGDNAFFGVVNVVTRGGKSVDGAEASAALGSFDTREGRFTWGSESAGGVEALVSASVYDSEGDDDLYFPDFDDPPASDGHARDLDDESAQRFFGKLAYGDLQFEGGYVSREKQLPTARYDSVFGDPHLAARDNRMFLAAGYTHGFDGGWELSARASYDRYEYQATYPYAVGDAVVVSKEDNDAQWLSSELQARRAFGERHLLTVGAEYRDVFSVDQQYYDLDPYYSYFDGDPDFSNWGVYAQHEIRVNEQFIVNLGARFDDYDSTGQMASPRLGLIWAPRAATTLKLLYGEAFRAPNVNELYYQDGEDIRDVNPDLDPEEIVTWEAVWEQQIGARARTTVSVYRNEVTELIEFSHEADLVETYYHENEEDVTVDGAELEIELAAKSGIRGRASYAWASVDYEDPHEEFDNSPEELAKFNLIVPLGSERLTAALEAQYTSARMEAGGTKVSSYWIANATLLAQPFGERLDLGAGLYNLLDEEFEDPAYGVPSRVEQDGRTFRVMATYRF